MRLHIQICIFIFIYIYIHIHVHAGIRRAKTTVDMTKGLPPSTCQTRLSPSTCKKMFPTTCQRRLSPLTCQKSVRRCAKMMVSVNMPKICARRHAKTTSYSVTALKPWNFRHSPRAGSKLVTCIFTQIICCILFLHRFSKFYRHYFWQYIWHFTGQCLACDSKFCSLVTPKSFRLWLQNHHHHHHHHYHDHYRARARRRSDSVASCRCASTREDLTA